MSCERVGVLCRDDGVAIEVMTAPSRDRGQTLVVEVDAASGSRRVVGVMQTFESARAEAELHVLRAGGLLETGAAQLLGHRARRCDLVAGAWLWRSPVCR